MTTPPSTARRLRRAHAIVTFLALFGLVSSSGIAQTANNSIANSSALPLRNIQIEVRQVLQSDRQQAGVQASGGLQIGGNGQADAQARLQLRQQQTQQSTTASQQVLVLNGRSARIALRTSTPLRVVQTLVRNGTVIVTRGTVLLDATTGFLATPRWDGSNGVELELAASQAAPPTPGMPMGAAPLSSAASTLMLPLGEWVTVAESDQDSRSTGSGLGGSASQTDQGSSALQVRLTVR